MKRLISVSVLLMGLGSTSAQAGSTLRCGSNLISLGDSEYQVMTKCGQPAEESMLGYREIVNRYGHVTEVRVNEWVYGPRNGMYHYLRFEGGNLVRISSSR